MRARIRVQGETADWFQTLEDQMGSRPLGRNLLVSVGAHAIALWAGMQFLGAIGPYRPRPAAKMEDVKIVRLHLPTSILYLPAAAKAAKPDRPVRLPVPQVNSQQTLWQPNTVPRPEVAIAVPNVVQLSAPEPTPRPFLAPGRTEPVARKPVVLAQPDLAVTSARLTLPTSALPKVSMPKLPSGGRPLISAEPTLTDRPVSASSLPAPADSLMLLALNPAALPLRPAVDVPLVSQQSAAGTGGTAPLQSVGDRTTPAPLPQTVPQTTLVAAPKPIEMVHPDNRVFDVVVIRSGTTDDLQSGLLKSQTIYSAYLDVGAPKHWLLEYCTAGEAGKRSGIVISLPNPVKLDAPFPRHTIIPPLSQLRSEGTTVIRGALTSLGRFAKLEFVRGAQPLVELLLPYLAQWEFRPAAQAGRAAEIEIVLSIPPLR